MPDLNKTKAKKSNKYTWITDGIRFFLVDSASKASGSKDIRKQTQIDKSNIKNSKNKRVFKDVDEGKDENEEKANNIMPEVKVSINNICGNKNDIKVIPWEFSISEEQLSDLNQDCIKKVIDTINQLPQETLDKIATLSIPIFIFNIYNVLTSGKKNENNFK